MYMNNLIITASERESPATLLASQMEQVAASSPNHWAD
jgi:hypothetical protein